MSGKPIFNFWVIVTLNLLKHYRKSPPVIYFSLIFISHYSLRSAAWYMVLTRLTDCWWNLTNQLQLGCAGWCYAEIVTPGSSWTDVASGRHVRWLVGMHYTYSGHLVFLPNSWGLFSNYQISFYSSSPSSFPLRSSDINICVFGKIFVHQNFKVFSWK